MTQQPGSGAALRLTLASVSLLLGGAAYLGFRTEHLVLFGWAKALGLYPLVVALRASVSVQTPPQWVVFSLPCGLWAFAFTVAVAEIWKGADPRALRAWLCGVFSLTILPECGQALGLVPGVFDPLDLAVLLAGFALGVLLPIVIPSRTQLLRAPSLLRSPLRHVASTLTLLSFCGFADSTSYSPPPGSSPVGMVRPL